ncbi:MAG: EamA family transporter [Lachnospira sp.]|nr:EamA family transporter [Lachnospira sp.]
MKKYVNTLSIIYIIIGAALWGAMGLFVRNINASGFSSLDICFFRSIGTSLFLLLFLLIFNKNALKIKLRDLWVFLGTGLLSIVFFNYCYFTTITRTSLSVAAVLLYTSPAWVILMSSVVFKGKITFPKSIAVLMAIIGCVCVSGIAAGNYSALSLPDFLVGIGAGVGYALYSIFSRIALNKGYASMTITFYTFLIAAIGTTPFLSTYNIPEKIISYPSCVLPIIGLVVIATLLPYILYTTGLKNTTNSTAAVLACIEPVVATILGILLYNERLSLSNIIGIALILGASFVTSIKDK